MVTIAQRCKCQQLVISNTNMFYEAKAIQTVYYNGE